jgi:LPXTG-site transpeptidase (sortase) family protein
MKKIITICTEIWVFVTIVWWFSIIGIVVINFGAFVGTIQDTIWWIQPIIIAENNDINTIDKVQFWSIGKNVEHSKDLFDDPKTQIWYQKNIEYYLKRQVNNIKLSFNTLPPTNYLIIPDIGIQVKLVDTHMISNDILQKWDFESYLQQWVVKYPNTPDPGKKWNALLFGHTSLEPRKLIQNKYGTIFRNIPKLQEWSSFSVIRDGEKYDYNVITKAIKKPTEVKEFYAQYQDDSYVSLMWCFPIWTDTNRMMIVWQLTNSTAIQDHNKLMAYHEK